MTTERLVTEYTADTRNFRRGAQVYDQTLARQQRLTNDRLSRIDRRWERSTRSILNTRTALVGLTGYVGTQALRELRSYAEGWRDVERRLKSIGVVTEEGQKGFVGLALRTRSAIGGTAAAVQRFSKSTGDGIEITSRRVETLQKLLASAGSNGSERASVSLQLGQALQSGVLSGDEFRSIRENAPVEFLDALAKAAGITRQELKGFAEDQKLTSDIVLRALDGLASTADEKFGALAISGEEAFNVLSTGLTAYVGNVDETLGATATINNAMAGLGEYLSDAGDGAQSMAKYIQIVGAVALATAGSRGVGALVAAVQRSAATARFAAQEAQKEVAVSRQKVTAAQQELAASRALVAQRQAEVIARMQANRKLTGALKSLEAAKRKNAKASVALAGAEARAAVATDRLTAAQRRLSVAARASAAVLRTAKSVLAFFGGPLGLAITALTTLPLLIKDVDDRLTALQSVSDQAMQAMDRYAEASKRAGEEQERLGGKISVATDAMKAQSRVEIQDSIRELEPLLNDLLADVQRRAARAVTNIVPAFAKANGGFGPAEGFDPANPIARIAELNPILGNLTEQLQRVREGQGDLQALSASLEQVRSIGDSAAQAVDLYLSSIKSGLDGEQAAQGLIRFAESAGIFEDQLRAISDAANSTESVLAFDGLLTALGQASQTAQVTDADFLKLFANIVDGTVEAQLTLQAMQADVAGNTEEADRFRLMLAEATGQAETLAGTLISPPITHAANEAARLAENLAAARAERLEKLTGGNPDFFDPRNETGNAGRIFRPQPVPAQNRPGYEPPSARRGSGIGGGSGTSAVKEAERDLSAARELLIENGQKLFYVEKQLNEERDRLRDLLPSLINLGLSRADAEAVVTSELERQEEQLRRVRSASEEAAYAFAKGVLSDIRHADSLGDAIGRIGDRLLDLALDPAFDFLAQQFSRLATGGGGPLGQIFGALFNANGNAFGAAGIVPFANGGVVKQATPFRFGSGRLGVMGEAGPEAILPLSRGKNGKLGVVAERPTTPSMPAGSMQANSTFNWTGDMVIQSNSDQPQEVGREVTDQMHGLFARMFNKQLGDAMRGGGVLSSTFQKKAGG